MHCLFPEAENEDKKAGSKTFQADCLGKYQEKGNNSVNDSVLSEDRFEPVSQKTKNQEEIERDKKAIESQFEKKIGKGVISGSFHTMPMPIGKIPPLGHPRSITNVRGRILRFASRLVAARSDRAPYG